MLAFVYRYGGLLFSTFAFLAFIVLAIIGFCRQWGAITVYFKELKNALTCPSCSTDDGVTCPPWQRMASTGLNYLVLLCFMAMVYFVEVPAPNLTNVGTDDFIMYRPDLELCAMDGGNVSLTSCGDNPTTWKFEGDAIRSSKNRCLTALPRSLAVPSVMRALEKDLATARDALQAEEVALLNRVLIGVEDEKAIPGMDGA